MTLFSVSSINFYDLPRNTHYLAEIINAINCYYWLLL